MRREFRNQLTPFPEVASTGWTIRKSSRPLEGATDLKRRQMIVPLDDSAEAEYIRAHEMMHAQISPVDITAFMAEHALDNPMNVQAAEDLRITQVFRNKNNDLTRRLLTTRIIAKNPDLMRGVALGYARLGPTQELMSWARLIVACVNTADSATVRYHAGVALGPTRYARIASLLEDINQVIAEANANQPYPRTHHPVFPLAFTVKIAELLDLMESTEDDPFAVADQGDAPDPDSEYGQWGKAVLEEPRLTDSIRLQTTRIKHRQTDEGTRLRKLHRLCTDRRVFGIKKKTLGGSVLIDASSSMSLDLNEIMDIVTAAPAAVIAVYEGNPDTDAGYIRVVAKNGKLVRSQSELRSDSDLAGGGNVVDGPALEWLGQQSEPRFWVCDGAVTGCGDMIFANLTREAQALQAQHRIQRLNDLEDALLAFKAYKRKKGLR